mmetsp:Transcript_41623/g.67222  ORF Transcript_41623/g.67222 Transcript_41623/m.67222 type:complete len:253 (+) Transcript_41623:4833-5591(+)
MDIIFPRVNSSLSKSKSSPIREVITSQCLGLRALFRRATTTGSVFLNCRTVAPHCFGTSLSGIAFADCVAILLKFATSLLMLSTSTVAKTWLFHSTLRSSQVSTPRQSLACTWNAALSSSTFSKGVGSTLSTSWYRLKRAESSTAFFTPSSRASSMASTSFRLSGAIFAGSWKSGTCNFSAVSVTRLCSSGMSCSRALLKCDTSTSARSLPLVTWALSWFLVEAKSLKALRVSLSIRIPYSRMISAISWTSK